MPLGSVVVKETGNQLSAKNYIIDFLDVPVVEPGGGIDKTALDIYAKMYMGVPYLWGGRSVFGTDCSGFVQQVYKMAGAWLPRDAYMQADVGEPVGFLAEAQPGDLAFFDEGGIITHVGMMLNDHQIIHASGRVRIDAIDSYGIIDGDTGGRTHALRIIKRI